MPFPVPVLIVQSWPPCPAYSRQLYYSYIKLQPAGGSWPALPLRHALADRIPCPWHAARPQS